MTSITSAAMRSYLQPLAQMPCHSAAANNTPNKPKMGAAMANAMPCVFPRPLGNPIQLNKTSRGSNIETIHLFKLGPDIAVPLLQRYAKLEDRKVAEDLYAFQFTVAVRAKSWVWIGAG